MLVKNPHFIILCLIHSLSIGLSIAWGGLMNQAISPYGYSDNEIGNIAAIGVVGGTLGCCKFEIRRITNFELLIIYSISNIWSCY